MSTMPALSALSALSAFSALSLAIIIADRAVASDLPDVGHAAIFGAARRDSQIFYLREGAHVDRVRAVAGDRQYPVPGVHAMREVVAKDLVDLPQRARIHH
jgi:hypothetical protein